jgi:hypothetical protein
MIFRKQQTAPAPETAQEENPFTEAANALVAMEREGTLPEGFDLEAAVKDRAFAALLNEFEPKAAVRIYAAERRAEEAEQTAKARMSEKVQAQKALPKSQRTDRAVTATPNYMAMSKEAFHALEQQYRDAARNGRRVHI